MRFAIGLILILAVNTFNHQALAEEAKAVVIDVRTQEEFDQGHIEGALNIDFSKPDFIAQLKSFDRSLNYKIHCRSGFRSGRAKVIMESVGFKNVEDLGGLNQAAKKLNRKCNNSTC
jgi:rhodanese-related sulfurtransferase